jgi:hypothetical protein
MKAAALFLFATSTFGQTFHVTGTHKAAEAEKPYHTAFNFTIVVGTIENRRYTTAQLAAFGAYHFEVGTDYPVVKSDDKTIKVRVTDKKGRESTENLNIEGVEEVN